MASTPKQPKRIKGKEFFNYKRRSCDRKDGWRIRPYKDPYFQIMSHLMPMRCDSQVFMEEVIESEALDNFVRRVRRDPEMNMPELSRLAVIMAACVRAFSRYPKINRFVAGKKVYARNYFSISLTLKRSMHIDGEEETIKPNFNPNATLKEVYDILHDQLTTIKTVDNETSGFVDMLSNLPQFLIRSIIGWANWCDRHKGVPTWLRNLSPFHTSIYITDIGSTGINSVFHHIYNFGTTSSFLSIGKREKKLVLDENGQPKYINTLKFCYVIDERICDGFYYAKASRYITHLLKHPEELLERPETITEDPLY